jgi:NitT/TauT family transport system substrate-binding protein
MRRPIELAALAGGVLLAAATAQAQTKITYLLTSPVPTVAEAPHASVPAMLGFWKDAGIDVDVKPINGSTQATQLVIAGTADFTMATVEPVIIGRAQGAKIIGVYNHVREPIYTIAVTDKSAISDVRQLKGKSVGVLSLGSGAVPFAKAMFKSVGIDPDKDVKWLPIGLGPQAVNALSNNQVEAIAYWDWGYAILENAGFKFRHFTTPETEKLLSLALIGNEDFVNANPEATIKLAQGIAKATLFTITNPEAAVKIHWQKYPASKPAGIPEDQALKEAVHVLSARLLKYKIDNRSVPKWGAFTKEEWVATQDFLFDSGMVTSKLDAGRFYTDQFITRINSFDAAAIKAQAASYK